MTLLEQSLAIVENLKGQTNTMIVSNAMSELNDILVLQKADIQQCHKETNAAKEKEDTSKLTYRMIENALDRVKRHRQELRDERYNMGI